MPAEHTHGCLQHCEMEGTFCVFLYSCFLAPAEMPLHIFPLKEIFGSARILIVFFWVTAEIWHQEAGCPHVSHEFQSSLSSRSCPVSFLASLRVTHEALEKTNPFLPMLVEKQCFLHDHSKGAWSFSILSSMGCTLKNYPSHSHLGELPFSAPISVLCLFYLRYNDNRHLHITST